MICTDTKNSRNDRLYASEVTKKKDSAAKEQHSIIC